MRDPKRIDVITDKLNQFWKKHPDMRFWQMILYLLEFIPKNKVETDPFFWEDHVWEETLDKSLKK